MPLPLGFLFFFLQEEGVIVFPFEFSKRQESHMRESGIVKEARPTFLEFSYAQNDAKGEIACPPLDTETISPPTNPPASHLGLISLKKVHEVF